MSKGWKGELQFLIIRGINDLMKVALCLNIPWHDVYFIPNNEINWAHKKKLQKFECFNIQELLFYSFLAELNEIKPVSKLVFKGTTFQVLSTNKLSNNNKKQR